jgi:hypothetical protein
MSLNYRSLLIPLSFGNYPDWMINNLSSVQLMDALSLDINNTFNNVTSTFGSLSGTSKWYGGVLAPNGKIYGIPSNSTTVLVIGNTNISQDINKVCSRYLNKF